MSLATSPKAALSRRSFLGAGVVAPALPRSGGRPNILWICTDQQRFDTIEALGNPHIRTPNLDRLAASGVAFANVYCQSPICTPSRASFLTGCYPSTIHDNRNGGAWFPPESVRRLISRILAGTGYDCGLAGKLHLASCQNRPEPRVDDGYRMFKWSHQPMPSPAWPPGTEAYQDWLRGQGVDWAKEFGARKLSGWPDAYQAGISAKYDQTTWCAEEAMAFLREPRKTPWLMSVNPFSPHPVFPAQTREQQRLAEQRKNLTHPPPRFFAAPEYLERMKPEQMPLPVFQPSDLDTFHQLGGVDHQTTTPLQPAEYPARHMKAAYYASVELIDAQVGRLLDTLDETGQRDNTIVVFHSDHGEMLGDHGLVGKGCRFYEGAVHVPLLVSWPARFRRGVICDALVELTDIVPTLLESVGLPQPEYVQGRSLVPYLTGGAPDRPRRFVRCEYYDAIRMPRASRANMLFDGRWKLVVYHGQGLGELYDLKEDPGEFHNRWAEPAARQVKADLIARLLDDLALSADPGPPRIASF